MAFDNKEISSEFLPAPEFLEGVEVQRYRSLVEKLTIIANLLSKCKNIVGSVKVPNEIDMDLDLMIREYTDMKKSLEQIHHPRRSGSFDERFAIIERYYKSFFSNSISNNNILVINTISSFESLVTIEKASELDALSIELKSKSDELKEKSELADHILRKLENPSAERVLSDYASEYQTEANLNDKIAYRWLVGAVLLVVLFVSSVVLSIQFEWFPSILKLTSTSGGRESTNEIINIPVLVTKLMVISILIFVIIFCFRQYSIYKNLSVLNRLRMNAFNSYVLFVGAMGERDSEAKKALLISLAKTIHESVNTGFLSIKEGGGPVQNIDLSKLSSL